MNRSIKRMCYDPGCGHLWHKGRCLWPTCQCKEAKAGLTKREIQVLELMARDSAHKEIAAVLKISPKTVGAHITSMYKKTATHGATTLVLAAVRAELVKLESLPAFPCPVLIIKPKHSLTEDL